MAAGAFMAARVFTTQAAPVRGREGRGPGDVVGIGAQPKLVDVDDSVVVAIDAAFLHLVERRDEHGFVVGHHAASAHGRTERRVHGAALLRTYMAHRTRSRRRGAAEVRGHRRRKRGRGVC